MDVPTLELFDKIHQALAAQFQTQKHLHDLGSALTTKYLDLQARVDDLEKIVQTLRTHHDQLASHFDEHGHLTPDGAQVTSLPGPRQKTLESMLDKE